MMIHTDELPENRLAVLIPVLNNQPGLFRALWSLAEDGSAFDVFVFDDGSDPPVEIPDSLPFKVRLIRSARNMGITYALNTGMASVAAAGYQYVARLDAGDVSLPGRFAAQMAFLDDNPLHGAVGTSARFIDEDGGILFDYRPPTTHEALIRFYRYRSGIVHPTVMMRVSAVSACGCYGGEFPGGEDYDLFMYMSKSHKLANLPDVFVLKEVSARQITANRRALAATRVRLLWHHFDPASIDSYLGILINIAAMWVPRALMLRLKGIIEGRLA